MKRVEEELRKPQLGAWCWACLLAALTHSQQSPRASSRRLASAPVLFLSAPTDSSSQLSCLNRSSWRFMQASPSHFSLSLKACVPRFVIFSSYFAIYKLTFTRAVPFSLPSLDSRNITHDCCLRDFTSSFAITCWSVPVLDNFHLWVHFRTPFTFRKRLFLDRRFCVYSRIPCVWSSDFELCWHEATLCSPAVFSLISYSHFCLSESHFFHSVIILCLSLFAALYYLCILVAVDSSSPVRL